MSFTWQSKQTFIAIILLNNHLRRSYQSEFIVNLLEFQKPLEYQKKSTEISSFFLFIVNSRLGPIRQWISKCCIESRYEAMLETCKYYHIRTHIICMHYFITNKFYTQHHGTHFKEIHEKHVLILNFFNSPLSIYYLFDYQCALTFR